MKRLAPLSLASSRIDVRAAAETLLAAFPSAPRIAVVLGSGLSRLVDALTDTTTLPFTDVPGLPPAGVAGHDGRFVFGHLDDVAVCVQAGRHHGYEGYPLDVVVAPVRILAELGAHTVFMTNAVGGIHPRVERGDIVLLEDQMNFTFRSPLAGPVVADEHRFPDMSAPFDGALGALARSTAAELGIRLLEGTYGGVLGPAYETAAEVRMLARLGADVVGMSTVPEVITARALGLRCVGLSIVTNRATGLGGAPVSHEDVLEASREAGARLVLLITHMIRRLSDPQSTCTK